MLDRLKALLPSRAALITAVLASALGGAVAIGVSDYLRPAIPPPSPPPVGPADFLTVGRAYSSRLSRAYADAWARGAEALDAGKSPAEAIEVVSEAWAANRKAAYDAAITPGLERILPSSVRPGDETPAERAALAAAFRALAEGLSR